MYDEYSHLPEMLPANGTAAHDHADPSADLLRDQAWYQSEQWQAGEAEATAQIDAGALPVYADMAGLLAAIDAAPSTDAQVAPVYAVDPYGDAPIAPATFFAVTAEVMRAIAKRGLTHSPINPAAPAGECLAMLVEETGKVAHALTYDADPDALAGELLQVAAVALMWFQARTTEPVPADLLALEIEHQAERSRTAARGPGACGYAAYRLGKQVAAHPWLTAHRAGPARRAARKALRLAATVQQDACREAA